MPSGLLPAVTPALGWLLAATMLLLLMIRRSQARWSWRRVAAVAASESGGVQTLSFVLTFPFFVTLLLFIVQISQVMIGLMVVHYAAFAAGRSAQVWIPAPTQGDGSDQIPQTVDVRTTITLNAAAVAQSGDQKFERIWSAAVLACLPISPSRNISTPGSPLLLGDQLTALQALYPRFDTSAQSNSMIPARLERKLRYSAAFTTVALTFTDRSSGPQQGGNYESYNPVGHPHAEYLWYEAGWQDPVTVTVMHDFRLLPGPGRWLAARLSNTDTVARRIHQTNNVRQVTLAASTTMTIEGLKSVHPVTEQVLSAGGQP